MTTLIGPIADAVPSAPTPAEGASLGRRVATQLEGVVPPDAEGSVESLARVGIARLHQMGINVEVIRSRPGCLVVRSSARPPGDAGWACAVVGGWLEALPGVLDRSQASVVEPSCAVRGAHSCIHTVMWSVDGTVDGTIDGRAAADPLPGTAALDPIVPASFTPSEPPDSRAAPAEPADPTAQGAGPDARASTGPLPVFVDDSLAPPAEVRTHPGRLASVPLRFPDAHARTGQGRTAERIGRSGTPRATRRDARAHRWPSLRRRAWLLLLGVLAGTGGGAFASMHGAVSYGATAVLEVTGPSVTSAASQAQGAAQLAVTYAALIPSDQALLRHLAARLGSTPSALTHQLDVQAESGTALIEVRFTASSPSSALAGANDVADALTSTGLQGRAVAPGTVTVVSSARTASRSGTLHKYGLPLGVVLGLAVGAGAVVVAERADRRVDDIETLAQVAGCDATCVPGGISCAELARSLARSGEGAVTVVPLRPQELGLAGDLAHALEEERRARAGDGGGPQQVGVAQPLTSSSELLGTDGGRTVLVVAPGARAGAVRQAADRLRLVGREPTMAVLASRARASTQQRAVGTFHDVVV